MTPSSVATSRTPKASRYRVNAAVPGDSYDSPSPLQSVWQPHPRAVHSSSSCSMRGAGSSVTTSAFIVWFMLAPGTAGNCERRSAFNSAILVCGDVPRMEDRVWQVGRRPPNRDRRTPLRSRGSVGVPIGHMTHPVEGGR